jgi:3-carboxy-cis,cis-muconate cycloisomerase
MLSSAAMRGVRDDAYLPQMLDFEAAPTRGKAAAGVVPKTAVAPFGAACRAELFNLAEAGTRSGNLAIPLVKARTSQVARGDAADTATMLGLRAALDAK